MVSPQFDAQVSGYVEATRRAGANGLLTLIHCEDHALGRDATARLLAAGKSSLQHYAESSPVVSEVVATQRANAAKLFGLYPRKGAIAAGSDADIVLFDPQYTRTIDRAMLKSNVDYSVYEGWEVTGWPILTISRGEVVYRDDEVIGQAGCGLLLPREATGRL